MNTQPKHNIVVSPIHQIDSELLGRVAGGIASVFSIPVKIMPLIDSLDFAFHWERRQYHSTVILEALDQKAPSTALKVLGVTDQDLFIPILTHVYGEAQLGGRASVISIYRLKEGVSPGDNAEQYYGRVVKEAIHELGHTFNLRHCKDPRCIMHYCRSITDVDRKSMDLCRYCRTLLDDEIRRLMDG
ncbi:MAG: peptidase M54 [Deltaproteobacteria bacterium]|nr:MAG: peptidase M54 [Deltaproteobacteria bacterium]